LFFLGSLGVGGSQGGRDVGEPGACKRTDAAAAFLRSEVEPEPRTDRAVGGIRRELIQPGIESLNICNVRPDEVYRFMAYSFAGNSGSAREEWRDPCGTIRERVL
jgi:hypothetical protein